MIPIGLNPTTINVTSEWWLRSARDAEAAGFKGVWSWDHFVSRGRKTDPVLECWTTLTAAAAVTNRIHVGSFINNVMNRHPAILARMVATLWDQSGGRVELGIGVGGSGPELPSYGITLPEPAVRSAILEEAVAVIRLLFAGGPASYEGKFFQLHEAVASPVPQPPPRIVVGGENQPGLDWRLELATVGRPTRPTMRRCCPLISRNSPRVVGREPRSRISSPSRSTRTCPWTDNP